MLDIQKEREAFEILCHDYGLDNEKDEENYYTDDRTNAAWCGWIDCAIGKQAEIDDLKAQLLLVQADTKRIDFLADKNQFIANVQLPREIVERNVSSLRDAIDEAMMIEEIQHEKTH